jgi:hypothetical protein
MCQDLQGTIQRPTIPILLKLQVHITLHFSHIHLQNFLPSLMYDDNDGDDDYVDRVRLKSQNHGHQQAYHSLPGDM